MINYYFFASFTEKKSPVFLSYFTVTDIRDRCTGSPIPPIKYTDMLVLCIHAYQYDLRFIKQFGTGVWDFQTG
jgi:hypothetical protein